MSKCGKHITSGHIEFVCQTIQNLTPSLIFNPSLTPPYSRPPLNPCFLPQRGGYLQQGEVQGCGEILEWEECAFHTLLVNRYSWKFKCLFWGLCLKILRMKTAASVHSCVKTTFSEMSCMHMFFSELFWTNHTSQCISFLHGHIVMYIL